MAGRYAFVDDQANIIQPATEITPLSREGYCGRWEAPLIAAAEDRFAVFGWYRCLDTSYMGDCPGDFFPSRGGLTLRWIAPGSESEPVLVWREEPCRPASPRGVAWADGRLLLAVDRSIMWPFPPPPTSEGPRIPREQWIQEMEESGRVVGQRDFSTDRKWNSQIALVAAADGGWASATRPSCATGRESDCLLDLEFGKHAPLLDSRAKFSITPEDAGGRIPPEHVRLAAGGGRIFAAGHASAVENDRYDSSAVVLLTADTNEVGPRAWSRELRDPFTGVGPIAVTADGLLAVTTSDSTGTMPHGEDPNAEVRIRHGRTVGDVAWNWDDGLALPLTSGTLGLPVALLPVGPQRFLVVYLEAVFEPAAPGWYPQCSDETMTTWIYAAVVGCQDDSP